MPLTTTPGATALMYARNKLTGQTYFVGASGPAGNPMVIVGDFGASKTPFDLPTDGALPADWDEAGDPAHQMVLAEGLIYNPADPTVAGAGHLYTFIETGWIDSGRIQGPQGLQGSTGVSSVIVGDFGAATTPADLPPDGLIPIDWDGPGQPATALQMETGWSLYYDKPTDPADGHLFQYVTTGIDPTGWVDIGLIQGPAGPPGPLGPPNDEIEVGPDQPVTPTVELWFDTDDDRVLGPTELPAGGGSGAALTKVTDLDGDVEWRDPHTLQAGEIIQFPNVADVQKINLYSNTFGFGIESGTLTAYSSSRFRFRQNSLTGTEWASIDGTRMYDHGHYVQRQILQNAGFRGPWDGEGTAAWTVFLQGGSYMFYVQASGLSSSVGLREIQLKVDGIHEASCNIWINTLNAHTCFVGAFGTGSYGNGNHTITLHNGGSVTSDVNDFGTVMIIPQT